FISFGPFSVSLVLIPIVVGAALYGVAAGAWLGFVFGLVVLLSGDAAAFLAVNVPGTILTVLLKGTLAGLCAAVVYRLFSKINGFFATVAAAVICPVVNTGIFIIGCHLFFMETISGWAEAAGFKNAGAFIIVGMIGLNFVFELLINVILSPVIVRILRIIKKPSQETA
ncbi:MAG: ECF transporter S component, partial [Eubacterium sp.]|nr:ECF transporter S component [Eubacterium sp.]